MILVRKVVGVGRNFCNPNSNSSGFIIQSLSTAAVGKRNSVLGSSKLRISIRTLVVLDVKASDKITVAASGLSQSGVTKVRRHPFHEARGGTIGERFG